MEDDTVALEQMVTADDVASSPSTLQLDNVDVSVTPTNGDGAACAATNNSERRQHAKQLRREFIESETQRIHSVLETSIMHPTKPVLGDTVIIYESSSRITPITLAPNQIFDNRFGAFRHEQFLNAHYGATVHSKQGGFVTMLRLTPSLWTRALTHRTQILYNRDCAFICHQLNLKAGDVVLESGTGSGSLTTHLAQHVRPHGHVHTFEFNRDRHEKALADFKRIKVDHLVTAHYRDVVTHGFPVVEGVVDAVFLDIPAPWTTIPSVFATLTHMGRVASFSPCIEQVQRTVKALEANHFIDIKTFECSDTEYEVLNKPMCLDSLTISKAKSRSLMQQKRRKRTNQNEAANESQTDAEINKSSDANELTVKNADATVPTPPSPSTQSVSAQKWSALANIPNPLIMTRPFTSQRGHTGYLTFASCWHEWMTPEEWDELYGQDTELTAAQAQADDEKRATDDDTNTEADVAMNDDANSEGLVGSKRPRSGSESDVDESTNT